MREVTAPGRRDQWTLVRPGLLYRVAFKQGKVRVVVTNRNPRNRPGTWLGAYAELSRHSKQIDQQLASAGPQRKWEWWDDRIENGRWGVTYRVEVNLDDPDESKLRELNQAAAAMKAMFGPRIAALPAELEHASLGLVGGDRS